MKITGLVLAMLLFATTVFASESRYALKSHEHPAQAHQPSADRNFYVPLETEINITPQRFRTRYFQGIFSTNGVQLGGHEPVFFAGALARFDIFPDKSEGTT